MISKVTLITVPRRYGIPTLLVALFWAVGYSAASAQNIQDGNIIIATGGTYTITGSSTAHTIKVNTGVTANITLDNVSIDVSATTDACAFDIASGATVHLTLAGNSVLKSGDNKAGILLPNNATLNISGNGTLVATGGGGGAGIGGNEGRYDDHPESEVNGESGGSCGTVNISSGTVTATGWGGAGIGGGAGGPSNNQSSGPGGAGGTVTITGGAVTATGQGGGAGIGGGKGGDHTSNNSGFGGVGGTVNITGGTVTATGNGGAGIGGGAGGNVMDNTTGGGGSGGNLTISGGKVQATGNSGGAGIGGGKAGSANCEDGGGNPGKGGSGGTVNISGGEVTVTGSEGGAGIGGASDHSCGGSRPKPGGDGGDVIISGGTVKVTGGGTGIGHGNGGSGGSLTITGGSINASMNITPTDGIDPVYLNTLTVGSSAITNMAITSGSIGGAPGYGFRDVKTDAAGRVYLYLPASSGDELVVLATGSAQYEASYARTAPNSYTKTLARSPQTITLSTAGTHIFPSATYGYGAPASLNVTVTNTGSAPTGNLTVALSGADAAGFTLSASSIASITASGATNRFTVTPKTGLNAGTYTATVTVSNANVSALFDVSFTVDRAVPTAEYLDYTLSDIIYDGEFHSIPVAPKEGVSGLGNITVRYNGYTVRPDEDGAYTVTVEIAGNDNYETVILELGTFTIHRPTYPFQISRTVTLPYLPGVATLPAAGSWALSSGKDFEFIILPSSATAGRIPVVTTGRETDAEGGAVCTPNDDGSYTVRIRSVRQNLTIGIEFVAVSSTGSAGVQDSRVWSSGSRLYLFAARTGKAYIYNVSGRPVKILSTVAGETYIQPLPPGIYFVAAEGKSHRVVITE